MLLDLTDSWQRNQEGNIPVVRDRLKNSRENHSQLCSEANMVPLAMHGRRHEEELKAPRSWLCCSEGQLKGSILSKPGGNPG